MANSTMVDDTGRLAVCGVLALVLVWTLTSNCLLLVTAARSARLGRPPYYLLVNLGLADLLGALLWGLPSLVTAALGDWVLGSVLCTVQSVVTSLCVLVNMHTFIVVAFEKFLKVTFPLSHERTFYKTLVLILVGSIWLFDLVVALFPVYGYGEIGYIPKEFQCYFLYMKSLSHLNFTFTVTFGVSFLVTLILFLVTFHKIRKAQQQMSPEGRPIIQENSAVPAQPYASRLRQQQLKIHKNNGLVQQAQDQYTDLDDGGESENSDGEVKAVDRMRTYEDYQRTAQKARRRRYELKPYHVSGTITMFITWLLFLVCWLPFMVVSYLGAYNFKSPPPEEAYVATSVLCFVGGGVKTLVYMTNSHFRKGVKEAFRRKKKTEST